MKCIIASSKYTLINIEKTKAWTKATINSNTPNKTPNGQIKDILQIKDNKMCPAVILANKRKQRVTGRTNSLVNSTRHKNGIKYQGEFRGIIDEKDSFLIKISRILLIQHNKATVKLNLKVVVRG